MKITTFNQIYSAARTAVIAVSLGALLPSVMLDRFAHAQAKEPKNVLVAAITKPQLATIEIVSDQKIYSALGSAKDRAVPCIKCNEAQNRCTPEQKTTIDKVCKPSKDNNGVVVVTGSKKCPGKVMFLTLTEGIVSREIGKMTSNPRNHAVSTSSDYNAAFDATGGEAAQCFERGVLETKEGSSIKQSGRNGAKTKKTTKAKTPKPRPADINGNGVKPLTAADRVI